MHRPEGFSNLLTTSATLTKALPDHIPLHLDAQVKRPAGRCRCSAFTDCPAQNSQAVQLQDNHQTSSARLGSEVGSIVNPHSACSSPIEFLIEEIHRSLSRKDRNNFRSTKQLGKIASRNHFLYRLGNRIPAGDSQFTSASQLKGSIGPA